MAHSLQRKIAQVRHRARFLVALHAAGWTVAAVLAAVTAIGLIDYLVRFQDSGIRLMSSLAVLVVCAWAGYRFWYRGFWQNRPGDVQIARRIERRFPTLTDRLASAIQFLGQSELDPQAGSAALRRAVIVETAADVERLNVREVLEPRPAGRALAAAGLVALLAVGLVAASPSSARIALARLARPLGDDAWPRYYRVEFRSAPSRLAAGSDFEVELISDDEHRVPDDVQIYYRFENEGASDLVESEPMRWVGGAMVARKENVSRPFYYRAAGGDDTSMDWIRLEVLEPPRFESVKLTLHPPAYSGLPVEESATSIHALTGTRVALQGTVTKKLRSATLRRESREEIPLAISEDGYSVALAFDAEQPFAVDTNGRYSIELEDDEGLIGGLEEQWDIRAVPDLEPTVTIEQPGSNVFVTPRGEVAVRVAVKDDLAIHEIALHYRRTDRTDVEEFVIPLESGAERAPQFDAGALTAAGQLGDSRVVEHRWLLEELNLKPATQLTFWATASDYLPQTGQSTVRNITIITPADLEERLAQRQTLVFAELQRVLKMQQAARTQTESLEIQLGEVGRIGKTDVDQAQSAELNQRQVARTLTSPSEGVPAQIADFLTELRSNRVDSPDVERRMTGILDEIARLDEEHLGAIESELTRFIKAAQMNLPRDAESQDARAPADDELRQSLATAGRNQQQVVSSLESMLGELGRWDNYRRFAREITQLRRDQQEIAKQTKELRPNTLGRDSKQLTAQQQADLAKLSNRQIDLSRRLEKIQQQMEQMSKSLAESDPIASATVADGLHQARQQAISGQMRSASEQVQRNQLGQAAQRQAKIAEDLNDLLSVLSNRREQELTRLVKQLREAESELSKLRKQQAGLRKKMKAAAAEPDPVKRKQQLERLTRQQKQLAQDAARLARRLKRLQSETASRSTSSAAGNMAGAAESAGQGGAAAAEQNAAAAEKDLEEAQQQLAERRQQAEQDLAREQLARLEDSLKSLHQRQEKLIAETDRMQQLRVDNGRLSRAQLGTVGSLARQQNALRGETAGLAEKLAATRVIHLALDGAAGNMARAAELLEDRQTGPPARRQQELAKRRLAHLLTAFENKKQQPGKPGGGGGGGSGGGSGARPDGNFVLTQLKLLRLLQEDLNQRYNELVDADNPPDAEQVGRQLDEMAREQGKLAELTLELSEPPADNPEDNPEKLPDVRQDDADPGELLPNLLEELKMPQPGEAPPLEVPPPEAPLEPQDAN